MRCGRSAIILEWWLHGGGYMGQRHLPVEHGGLEGGGDDYKVDVTRWRLHGVGPGRPSGQKVGDGLLHAQKGGRAAEQLRSARPETTRMEIHLVDDEAILRPAQATAATSALRCPAGPLDLDALSASHDVELGLLHWHARALRRRLVRRGLLRCGRRLRWIRAVSREVSHRDRSRHGRGAWLLLGLERADASHAHVHAYQLTRHLNAHAHVHAYRLARVT